MYPNSLTDLNEIWNHNFLGDDAIWIVSILRNRTMHLLNMKGLHIYNLEKNLKCTIIFQCIFPTDFLSAAFNLQTAHSKLVLVYDLFLEQLCNKFWTLSPAFATWSELIAKSSMYNWSFFNVKHQSRYFFALFVC